MVRRGIVALLVVGLLVGGVAGWKLFTGAAPDRSRSDRADVIGSADDGWQRLGYHGLSLEVPGEWHRLDTSGCSLGAEHWGLVDADPCAEAAGLWFYASATFDPATGPGVHQLDGTDGVPTGGWGGYVTHTPDAVYVQDPDAEVVRRVLRSVEG